MRVAVIGVHGQLAQSLFEKASSWPSLEIVALGRPQADLEQPGSVAKAISNARPNVVINAAAYTAVDQAEDEPQRAFRVNADAAGEAASAAAAAGAPIIQISTDYVFDGRGEGAYREDAPTDPLTVYGRSKLAGEEQVRCATPNHLIVRTAWVYSPFGRNFVKTMIEAARSRAEITVVADQFGSPTSALDLAEGLLAIVETLESEAARGLGEIYHLAGSGEASWCRLAEAVMGECRHLGLPAAKIRGITTAEWPTRAVRPPNSLLDSGKVERDFGIRLPDWHGSVAETVRRLAAQ